MSAALRAAIFFIGVAGLSIVFKRLTFTILIQGFHDELNQVLTRSNCEVNVAHPGECFQKGQMRVNVLVGHVLVNDALRLDQSVIQPHDKIDWQVKSVITQIRNMLARYHMM